MKNNMLVLSRNPFVRNVLILSSGTAASQLVALLLAPIITRLYGPEAYGLMGTFLAIISIIAPISALTYPIAIVLPKENEDAKKVVKLSFFISIIMSMLIGVLFRSFHIPIVDTFQLERIENYLFIIPFVVLCAGILQIIEQWLIRTKQFGITAKATFSQAVIINLGKVGVGLFHPVSSVLILFSASIQGLKAMLMLKFTKGLNYKSLFRWIFEKSSIKEVATKYKEFPIYRAPEVFLSAVSQSLPILMLTSYFGPASVGYFSIGNTVLAIPSVLIGKSVGDVFYPRIAEAANNNENLTKIIKKATLALGIVGIVPYGIIVIFGPSLFSFVFGSEWAVAGEYARWMALWSFFMFINQPSVRALPVLLAQSLLLKFTIITLIIRFVLLSLGYYVFASDMVAIALYGVSGAVLNIILIVLTIKKSMNHKID